MRKFDTFSALMKLSVYIPSRTSSIKKKTATQVLAKKTESMRSDEGGGL